MKLVPLEKEVNLRFLWMLIRLPRIAHSRDKVWYYLHKSLKDLMLDYIDLYLIEFPVPGQPGFLKRGSQVIECHLYMAQNKTVSFCKNHGVAVTAYAPLGKTSGVPGFSMASHPLIDPAVVDLARRLHRTPAQVLLRYQVQRGLAVLTRSENPDHIHENFQIFDFQLTPDQMSMLQGLDRNLRLFKHDRYDGVVQHPEYPFRSLF
ncbi:hypothetical protein HPB47_027976 [Ixodes persulcatus]|uniref:Uncharacterized protein n=1 Tax=Ixodes persulcatus TaxID=34615 RepID=A0AC60PVP7_IXOPE|nr:hypothetical protein HPB47_027976 [Ixodes persulcatus]